MKEQVSALLDGELELQAVSPCLERLEKSPELCNDWGLYQLIGDQLRGAPAFSPSFPARFSTRLAHEPTVFVRHRLRLRRMAAQPARFLIPALASLLGVAMVAWAVLSFSTRPSGELMAVTGPAPVPIAASSNRDYFQTRPGSSALPAEISQGTTSVDYPAERPRGR